MSDKQLFGLTKFGQVKSKEALSKTEQAIAYLTNNRQKITIRSVARKAGVSASYIYKHPELAYKIQRLREQQRYTLVESEQDFRKQMKKIEILAQEKAKLELENAELRAIIERAKTDKSARKELKAENIQLATENIRLKAELEYTLKNLQEARTFILEQGRVNLSQQEKAPNLEKIRQISKE